MKKSLFLFAFLLEGTACAWWFKSAPPAVSPSTATASVAVSTASVSVSPSTAPSSVAVSTAAARPGAAATLSTSTATKTASVVSTSTVPVVQLSTATGKTIEYSDVDGTVRIEGDAVIYTASGTVAADRITANLEQKTAVAEGNIKISNSTGTITAQRAVYNWETSTGTIYGFTAVTNDWHVIADTATQLSPGLFEAQEVDLTSCDLPEPDYVFHSNSAHLVPGKRVTLYNARFKLGLLPVLWTPVYTRSLVPTKYKIRIEPGASGRDGLITRTTLSYPFTPNSYTRFKWDWLQNTGNGAGLQHNYFAPTVRGDLDAYYIRDTNPDPQPQSKRYTLLWHHYQKLTSQLSANASIDLKSDQTFGNEFPGSGNDVFVENQARGLLSDTGFTYQFSKAAIITEFNRKDRFDTTVSSSSFISKLTLPSISLTTIPLISKYFPIYTSFSALFLNETLERTDPKQTLRYQRSGNVGMQLQRDIKLSKKTTLIPKAGYLETWQDRDLTVLDSYKDLYIGRYNLGGDLRRRMTRNLDATVGYTYATRFQQNRFDVDDAADDHGVETNRLVGTLTSRIGRGTRLSLASGYELRDAPKSAPTQFDNSTARIIPPSLDLEVDATNKIRIYYRETYSVYDPVARESIATPANTSGEIEYGDFNSLTYFSQGFAYSKPTPGTPSVINFNNKIRFFLTNKWYVSLVFGYSATGTGGLNYYTTSPVERTIAVARDMHCWVLSMRFSERPGRTEASFHIDLKTSMRSERDIFRLKGSTAPGDFDEADLFPEVSEPTNIPLNTMRLPASLAPE